MSRNFPEQTGRIDLPCTECMKKNWQIVELEEKLRKAEATIKLLSEWIRKNAKEKK